MKKIAIINAYGKKNIGDAAIQESAFNFLNQFVESEDRIFLLSVDAYRYKKDPNFHAKILQQQLPYGYAIQSLSKPLSRTRKLYRFMKVVTVSLSYTFFPNVNKKYVRKKTVYAYIRSIIDADIIIGMGGGYFTTRYGMSDNFGLFLTLLPIYIAKIYHKKIIFLPLTFGPFANATHERLTHTALANTTIFCRDSVSLESLEKLNTKKFSVRTIYTPDLALFLSNPSKKKSKKRDNYYVVTAREWMTKDRQAKYENELRMFIQKNWEEKKLKAIFIPMAYNAIEDDDRRVAERLERELHNKDIFTIVYARSPEEVQKILGKSQFAICTRMHSAILSFTTETPFITIAYSPKINNFLKDFGLSNWNINIEDFNADLLNEKISKLTEQETYEGFINQIRIHKSRLNKQKKEFQTRLQSYIN